MLRTPTTAERWLVGLWMVLAEVIALAALYFFCQTSTVQGMEVRLPVPTFTFGTIQLGSEDDYIVYTEGPSRHSTKTVSGDLYVLRAYGLNQNGVYQSQTETLSGMSQWGVDRSGEGILVARSLGDRPIRAIYNDGNVRALVVSLGSILLIVTAVYAFLSDLNWYIAWRARQKRMSV